MNNTAFQKIGMLLTIFIYFLLIALTVRSYCFVHHNAYAVARLSASDAAAWHLAAFEAHDLQNAILREEKAVRYAPQDVYFQEHLAALYASGGRFQDALNHYKQAIQCAPQRAINYASAGELLFHEGRLQEAEPYFEHARALEPFFWQADFWLAKIWITEHQNKRALFLLQHLQARYLAWKNSEKAKNGAFSVYENEILSYDLGQVQDAIASLGQVSENKQRHVAS